MTEAEAKTKWCPFARLPFHDGPTLIAANRYGYGDVFPEASCIGSACMAWREIIKGREVPSPAPLGVREKYVAGGYCGLAGKP